MNKSTSNPSLDRPSLPLPGAAGGPAAPARTSPQKPLEPPEPSERPDLPDGHPDSMAALSGPATPILNDLLARWGTPFAATRAEAELDAYRTPVFDLPEPIDYGVPPGPPSPHPRGGPGRAEDAARRAGAWPGPEDSLEDTEPRMEPAHVQ